MKDAQQNSLSLVLAVVASLASAQTAGLPKSTVIGPDDTVTIQVVNNDELSKPWRVSSGGDLSLPLAGRVHAAGLTIEQLEAEVVSKLKRYILNPQLTAYISDFRSQPVMVSGAVATPGTFQLVERKTLYDMILQAGGPKDAGATMTLRRDVAMGEIPEGRAKLDDSKTFSLAEFQLAEVMQGYGPAATLVMKPHDVISISAVKDPKFVYISGEVLRSGSVELVSKDQIPLTVLVAMSGGLTRNAAPGKAFLMRKNVDGPQSAVTKMDLKKVITGKNPDIMIHPGDIVVVPSSQVLTYIQALSMSAANAGFLLLGKF